MKSKKKKKKKKKSSPLLITFPTSILHFQFSTFPFTFPLFNFPSFLLNFQPLFPFSLASFFPDRSAKISCQTSLGALCPLPPPPACYATASNTVPEEFKSARVRPLLEKNSWSDVGNYRPVSILCVSSKILEKAVFTHVDSY